MATQEGQLLSARVRQRERQQGSKEKEGDHVWVCVSGGLTICSLHDAGVVVVAAGNASHRGHLGPLRMK